LKIFSKIACLFKIIYYLLSKDANLIGGSGPGCRCNLIGSVTANNVGAQAKLAVAPPQGKCLGTNLRY
jgi:hypothetical protein